MKLKPEQLQRHLENEAMPLYWLAGDEPLLMQEAADAIRLHCRNNGYTEREIFNVDKNFDWQLFTQAIGNLSLFAEQKVFDLRFSSAKLEDAGKEALQAYLNDPSPDYLVMISSPKVEASTLKTKWFKALDTNTALVQIWPINAEGLPAWLDQRLRQQGIQANAKALSLLCNKIEGNLLAAMQEIEKLKLLANNGDSGPIQLDEETVMQVVADSSRYSVYNLIDAALTGDGKRSLKVLQGLKDEGSFPLAILGPLAYELRSLLPMLEQVQRGQPVQSVIQSNGVWFNRKKTVTAALKRLKTDTIWQLLTQAGTIDQSIKGMSSHNPWDELSKLILALSGKTTATMQANGI